MGGDSIFEKEKAHSLALKTVAPTIRRPVFTGIGVFLRKFATHVTHWTSSFLKDGGSGRSGLTA
jgi:hypothetical protein